MYTIKTFSKDVSQNQFIHSCPQILHIHRPTNHLAAIVQDAGAQEAGQGRRLFAGRKGPCSVLSSLSNPCSGLPSWVMQQESRSPTPSFPHMCPCSPRWRNLRFPPGTSHAPPHTSSCTLDGRREENKPLSSLARHTLSTRAICIATRTA